MEKRELRVYTYIKDARKTSGYSQVAMAQELGIARQTYLDLESGRTEPRISTLLEICILTDKPLSYFVQDEINNSKKGLFLTERCRERARSHIMEALRLI